MYVARKVRDFTKTWQTYESSKVLGSEKVYVFG